MISLAGKIVFDSTLNIHSYNLDDFDYAIQIVRYTNRKGLLTGFLHVPQLAPSPCLFKQTFSDWRRLRFTTTEREFLKSGKTGTWFDLYEKAFQEEMLSRTELTIALKQLTRLLDEEKSILAMCYCEEASECHRSILAKYLKAQGYQVSLN